MTLVNSSQPDYEECLMSGLPKQVQYEMKDLTNYIVQPLSLLLAVASVVCNSMFILTVARVRSLHRAPLIMLCSLAISDFIYSSFSVFRVVEVYAHEHMCPKGTPEKSIFGALCNLTTLGSLAYISRDRYVAIIQPVWYRDHMTKSRAVKLISVQWLISSVIAFVLYLSIKLQLGGGYRVVAQIMVLMYLLVSCITIIICYLGMYVKRSQVQNEMQIRAIVEREKRLARTVGLILLVLILTFLPGSLFPVALSMKGIRNPEPFKPFYRFLLILNAFLNPLLNFGRNRGVRRAFKALFKGSQQVAPSLDNN